MTILNKLTYGAFIIISYLWQCIDCDRLLHSISDEVPGGNFSFYQVKARGRLRLELKSVHGDADMYLSSETLHPDYDNYEMKSTTCGEDSVEIAASLRRPIGVGVFGNFIYSQEEVSIKYSLSVFHISDADDLDYAHLDAMYNKIPDESSETSNRQARSGNPSSSYDSDQDSEDGESTLWQIALTILKILFDILL
ncbi:hypothetical protein FSP39_020948 [Pinctada imbricata]|uniref:Uncharacterized protein n=1 Tax=Pinctada imbricata TaxID=66713 RepID=A0AA89BX67_PINIB|nr:hypothetical protein FSP39_020948 [Pinctada imbricata]